MTEALIVFADNKLHTGHKSSRLHSVHSLPLLRKNTNKYFLPVEGLSLDWTRHLFPLSAFESAELSVAHQDELAGMKH
jgi:hypothetical protein